MARVKRKSSVTPEQEVAPDRVKVKELEPLSADLVLKVAKAMWRAEAGDWFGSATPDARWSDWNRGRVEWISKARRLIRQLQSARADFSETLMH